MKLQEFLRELIKLTCLRRRPDGTTFCNEFLQLAAMHIGYVGLNWRLIAQIHPYVSISSDWRELQLDSIHRELKEDALILALWSHPAVEIKDHGCILAPGDFIYSGQWDKPVPLCANVGKRNFYGEPLSYAFPKEQFPQFFLWKGHAPA